VCHGSHAPPAIIGLLGRLCRLHHASAAVVLEARWVIVINVFQVILDFYFASLLTVSGIAKAQRPSQFIATLRQQWVLPAWSITGAGYTLPWIEIGVAALLITGSIPIFAAVVVFTLFGLFLIAELILYLRKYQGNCGCYGAAHVQSVERASIITSAIFVCLAALHLYLSTLGPVISAQLRGVIGALCFAVGCWYVWHVRRRVALQGSYVVQTPASSFQIGDQFPVDLGIPLPPRTFLTVVSGQCNPCIGLSEELADADLGDWSLVMMILDADQDVPGSLSLAPKAQVVYDPERQLSEKIGISATPTALVLVEGRIIDQQIGPPLSWFTDVNREQGDSLL